MAIEVTVHDDAVEIRMTGAFDTTMCMSGGLRVPLSDIESARLMSWDEARAGMGWRVGGAYWPRLIAAGWYAVPGRTGARQLWAVFRDRRELLVIDTRLERPCRIVLQHPDRERLVWWINERTLPA